MERIANYDKALRSVIEEIIEKYKGDNDYPNVQFHPIIDEKNNRYELVAVGWMNRNERVFNVFFQADIIQDKVWIQADNNEYSIAERLVDKGVAKKYIVLAYYPEFHREHTEYAVC